MLILSRIISVISLVILSLATLGNVSAQKVALVLSGGGAKGLAHAGVIKALEENNIPIDYVAGTSMGAVVGAFYAAGYSADEIMKIVSSREMQNWIKNIPKKKFQYLYYKEEIDPSWVSLKLSLDSSFSAKINTSISKDYILNFELARYLSPASKFAKGDFDRLFVPYRSTASEIFTEKDIVLKKGGLSDAARASMAVPFLYRPIKINNELLFDGGIYNNFPVETAKEEFDPDLVIGVNVGTKKMTDYPILDDEDLLTESIVFAMLDKTDSTELNSDDIFIDVDLENYTALDFKFAKQITELGYQSAMKKMNGIKSSIDRRISDEELAARRNQFRNNAKETQIDSLAIDGFQKGQLHFINGRFSSDRPMSASTIEAGYNKIVSDDYFSNVYPSYRFDDGQVFLISGNPNPKLKGKIGGSLATRGMSQLYIGFDLKRLTRVLTHHSLGIHTGRFYQSFNAKSKIQFAGKKEISLTPQITYNRWNYLSTTDIFNKQANPEVLDTRDFNYALHFQLPVARTLKLKISSSFFHNSYKYSNRSVLISSDTLDDFRIQGGKFRVELFNNSLNYLQYPSLGSLLLIHANYFHTQSDYSAGNTSNVTSYSGINQNWYKIGLVAEKYFQMGSSYSIGLGSSAMFSNQPEMGTVRTTVVNQPGYFPLQDTKTMIMEKLRGRKFIAGSVKNIFHLSSNLSMRLEGHAYHGFEMLVGAEGQLGSYQTSGELTFAATSSLVYQSLIGPIAISLNYYDQQAAKWGGFFHLGYFLFNKKSLE